jgi:hypothetical protein
MAAHLASLIGGLGLSRPILAGHLIRFDDPRAFMGALRSFLGRIRE